jgi:prophage antirepressor-like protein
MNKKRSPIGVNTLLEGKEVRRLEREGKTFFVAVDAVAVLTGSARPAEYWEDLKRREPHLAKVVETAEVPGAEGASERLEVVDLTGLLRLLQSVPSPRAEKLKTWLARNAVERLEEAENPELAVMRTRRLYESRGYSRRWVDKRLRGVSARHELTGEWYKRGAKESDQFRALTNTLMAGGFGMDVEGYRRHKGLFKTGENLRDHMSDLELALTALGRRPAPGARFGQLRRVAGRRARRRRDRRRHAGGDRGPHRPPGGGGRQPPRLVGGSAAGAAGRAGRDGPGSGQSPRSPGCRKAGSAGQRGAGRAPAGNNR